MFQFDWEQKHWKSDAYIMSSYQDVTWSCSSWSGPGSVVLFFFFLKQFFFFCLFQLYLIDAMKKGQRQRGRHAAKGHGLDKNPGRLRSAVWYMVTHSKPNQCLRFCRVMSSKTKMTADWIYWFVMFFFHQWIFSDSDCEIRDHETFSHMDWPQSLDINHTESLGGAVRLSHQRYAQLGQG